MATPAPERTNERTTASALPGRSGPRLLVTAGPTREPIDEVRFLSNRSSGQMGIAIAAAGVARGWTTTLLLGPVGATPLPAGIALERFESTRDLQQRLARLWPQHDLLVMAAAVADHRPVPVSGKLRRAAGPITLQLEPTPDLLHELATTTRPDQRTVGFALEPADRLAASAQEKLLRKKLHAIVANPLETMDSTEVEGTLLFADGRREAPPGGRVAKAAFAAWLLDRLAPAGE